jgi:hypothetical protein
MEIISHNNLTPAFADPGVDDAPTTDTPAPTHTPKGRENM